MEKMNEMQHNQVADDELDQVAGGRNLFKVLTTEFLELFDGPAKKDNSLGTLNGNNIGVSTLEMRVDPMEQQEPRKSVKL